MVPMDCLHQSMPSPHGACFCCASNRMELTVHVCLQNKHVHPAFTYSAQPWAAPGHTYLMRMAYGSVMAAYGSVWPPRYGRLATPPPCCSAVVSQRWSMALFTLLFPSRAIRRLPLPIIPSSLEGSKFLFDSPGVI